MAIKKNEQIIEINPVEIVSTTIRIQGDTPLIMHKWSEKAKKMILDKQTKATKTKARDLKNPVEDFIDSMYWIEGEPAEKSEEAFLEAVERGARWGFPVTAIKQATISAAYRNGLSKDMASLRGAFFIDGEGPDLLADVKGDAPTMREDMVRVGMGVADIRFRGQFTNWYMDLTIRYNKNGQYTLEQIINLINVGGFSCGIGEWRPERDGQNGMYHVAGM
jgi:hypothetical protein